jgi:hypothetical protein
LTHAPAPTASARRGEARWAAACALLALCSVGSLLAWLFRLGTFAAWFWCFSVPAVGALIVIAVRVTRDMPGSRLATALRVGTIGGLVGTIGYDLFRVPFVLAGYRVLAPIDSYGVLLLGADSSSGWTGFAGWSFHFANGIGFGIAYACVALGRRWYWAVAWALVLETVTLVTPFAGIYGIRGKVGLIVIAYAAHLAYGAPLGRMVEHAGRTVQQLQQVSRYAVAQALWLLVVALFLWQRPFTVPARVAAGRAVAPGASAIVVHGRMSPAWLRVAPGGCAVIRNDDPAPYRLQGTRGTPQLDPATPTRVCFDKPGIHRLKTSGVAYSGGFVIVDREAA